MGRESAGGGKAEMTSPAIDIVERSLPLPEHAAKQLNAFHRFMRSYVGVFVTVVVVLSIALQPLITIAPSILLLAWLGVFRTEFTQRFFDYSSGLYMSIIVLLLEHVFGIKTRSFGHQEKFKRRSILLMNHVCHFDWMFFWDVVEKQGSLCSWKSVTKDMIKKVPILGICMQYMCNIFIVRRWKEDEKEFRKKLHYFNVLDLPLQLLLFPEGGDLTARSKFKSDRHADDNGLPHYNYCLHPRVTGFLYTMNALRTGHLDAVYDVTVAYPDALPKTEENFLKCMPREIHFHIRCFRPQDLPTDNKDLAQWLLNRWREKEERLQLFYTHKQFMEPIFSNDDVAHSSTSETSHLNGHANFKPTPEVVIRRSYQFCIGGLLFYLSMMVTFTYVLLLSWIWTGWVLFLMTFTFYKGYTAGIDTILPNMEKKRIGISFERQQAWNSTVTNGVLDE